MDFHREVVIEAVLFAVAVWLGGCDCGGDRRTEYLPAAVVVGHVPFSSSSPDDDAILRHDTGVAATALPSLFVIKGVDSILVWPLPSVHCYLPQPQLPLRYYYFAATTTTTIRCHIGHIIIIVHEREDLFPPESLLNHNY